MIPLADLQPGGNAASDSAINAVTLGFDGKGAHTKAPYFWMILPLSHRLNDLAMPNGLRSLDGGSIMRQLHLMMQFCLAVVLCAGCSVQLLSQDRAASAHVDALADKLQSLCWVAYSPTHYDPNRGMYPSEADIEDDLAVLQQAGFQGLVTYGSAGSLGRVPELARAAGFEGVLMGIWSPGDAVETKNAIVQAESVDGYVVGNEGLFFGRYDLDTVRTAIAELRLATGRPVATTEVLSSYFTDADVRQLGDWIFPNAHPYFANITDPEEAAKWTEQEYQQLREFLQDDDRVVAFKEVGLPSAGAPELSEANQASYYERSAKGDTLFFYFESFDQPWKNNLPVSRTGAYSTVTALPSRSPARFVAGRPSTCRRFPGIRDSSPETVRHNPTRLEVFCYMCEVMSSSIPKGATYGIRTISVGLACRANTGAAFVQHNGWSHSCLPCAFLCWHPSLYPHRSSSPRPKFL